MVSGNASLARQDVAICSGRSPSYWKANREQWPSPYCAVKKVETSGVGGQDQTLFHSTTTGCQGYMFRGKTMLDVLDESGGSYEALGRHIVAALLNAAAGLTPVLNQNGVRDMWNSYITRGYYEPTAGIRWDAEKIVTYIETTIQ